MKSPTKICLGSMAFMLKAIILGKMLPNNATTSCLEKSLFCMYCDWKKTIYYFIKKRKKENHLLYSFSYQTAGKHLGELVTWRLTQYSSASHGVDRGGKVATWEADDMTRQHVTWIFRHCHVGQDKPLIWKLKLWVFPLSFLAEALLLPPP